MCGRFARKSTQEVLAEWLGLELEEMPWFAPTFNAAPQSIQPVIRLNRDSGRRVAALMRWGLVPFWARSAKIGLSTINARAEKAATKPAFRTALKKRRCLVPADAYYEWAQLGAKKSQSYVIALTSGEPIAFTGFWESWNGTGGSALETFAILTTTANELLATIHDRMPVIIERKDYGRWLDVDEKIALPTDLLHPYAANQVYAWPVSDHVGNTQNNDAVNGQYTGRVILPDEFTFPWPESHKAYEWIDLPPYSGDAKTVRMVIRAIYPGSADQITCVGKVMLRQWLKSRPNIKSGIDGHELP